jgi:ketosteroid isomerase-like protein
MKTGIAIILCLLMFVPIASAEGAADQIFRELENRISHAVITKDATEMNKLFASDYTSVGVSGHIRSRAEVIEAYSSGRITISTAQTGKLTVRQYGDIAIVVGVITVSGKEDSTDISGQYAFTRVYKRDAGKWLAVSFQATPVK